MAHRLHEQHPRTEGPSAMGPSLTCGLSRTDPHAEAVDQSCALVNHQKAGIGREKNMKDFLTTLWTDDSGQDMAEYALLLVLIAVVVAVAVIALRNAITDGFNRAAGQLENAPT